MWESLKEVVLTEQVKKQVPFEVQEHQVDSWEEINIADVLGEKFDKLDVVRKSGDLIPDLLAEIHLREILKNGNN